MDVHDSEFLDILCHTANEQASAGYPNPLSERPVSFIYECFDDSVTLWPAWHRFTASKSAKLQRARIANTEKRKRHLCKRYSAAFTALDAALAGAEFVNCSLMDAWFQGGMMGNGDPLLGVKGLVGGKAGKIMLLTSMHARMIVIASEICLLMKLGFPDGASARLRTLYELAVKATLILEDSSRGGYVLAERFQVTAMIDWQRRGGHLDKESKIAISRARRNWGGEFFRGDNNWALPAMRVKGNRGRVTFADMEEAAQSTHLHHIYRECNDAIHSGPLSHAGSGDFRRRYPFNTRGDIDLRKTGNIGHATSYIMEVMTFEIARRLFVQFEQWDCMLHLIDFIRQIHVASDEFQGGKPGAGSRIVGC